eukprot:6983053-Prymnesium_polylepis.1
MRAPQEGTLASRAASRRSSAAGSACMEIWRRRGGTAISSGSFPSPTRVQDLKRTRRVGFT